MSRKPVIEELRLKRVAVNFIDSDIVFTGRLVDYDEQTLVIEACQTHAEPGETPKNIAGRQYVDRLHVFLTELPT